MRARPPSRRSRPTLPSAHAALAALAALAGAPGCGPRDEGRGSAAAAATTTEPGTTATTAAAAPTSASGAPSATASAGPDASAHSDAGPPPDAGASPCPAEMALVAGRYCPVVSQPCARPNPVAGHHCLAYGPSSCAVRERVPLRFCMDRYEWPNRKGELPLTLVSWPEARALCGAAGKRLCTEREFNFACEGEAMRPFVYGFERSDAICNADRPYRPRTFAFKTHDACMAEPACRAAFEAIDQRLPAGARPGCASGDGVYDLNGNANEWVMREDERAPRRSGLKGGWWGPVRNRCRPMTTAHLEGDFGYEAGFRCCRDAD